MQNLLPGETIHRHIDLLFELGREYLDLDNEMALCYSKEAFSASQQLSDTLRLVKTGRVYAQSYRRLSNLDSARLIYSQILPLAKVIKYKAEVKYILNGLGLVYQAIGRFDKALEYCFEALDIKVEDRDSAGMSVSFNNIALVYQNLKDYDKALTYYHKSLQLKNIIGDVLEVDAVLMNMGQCYAFTGKFDTALQYVEKGLSFCGKNCVVASLVVAHQTLGYIKCF